MKRMKKWVRFRHKVVTALARHPLGLYTKWKYRIRIEPFQDQGKRPYLILSNHQTGFDQFFVGLTFNRPVYYLASEDIFSLGWVSRLIEWLVAPISIKKQTMDLQAVKNCLRVAREGGTVCVFPEGQRTFQGKTVHINPAIAGLAKKMGLPIAIFRIEGGYGQQPRWSNVVRRGNMTSRVVRVIEPAEYENLTNEALFEILKAELTADETAPGGEFFHEKNAEFLERVVYTCPDCGLTTWESEGELIHCLKCGKTVRHLPNKELEGVEAPFPYRSVAQWYEAQENLVNSLDTPAMTQTPLWEETASIHLVHSGSHKELMEKDAAICLYGDRIAVGHRQFLFDRIGALTILGKNKLNIYDGGDIYQVKGGPRFNGLKYLNFYHRYKNLTTGDRDGKYLGL